MANDRNSEARLDDEALLREAHELIRPLPPFEPRVGFAARVSLAARDGRTRPFGAPWWRWAAGGLAAAGVAAAALLLAQPRTAKPSEVMLAQRLELYEDMSVLQNQEALEDLDVVAVLHQLQPEGAP
jgi:anti-sigma-K factor RskA